MANLRQRIVEAFELIESAHVVGQSPQWAVVPMEEEEEQVVLICTTYILSAWHYYRFCMVVGLKQPLCRDLYTTCALAMLIVRP